MTRNLKLLMAAALALVAFGAIGVAGAQAAGEEFHCSITPCRLTARQDGTGKTAHQVFIVENAGLTESVSFTCETVTAHARYEGKTTKEITFTEINYGEDGKNCTINGTAGVTVDTTGCSYLFTSETNANKRATVHIECETGKEIHVTVKNSAGETTCTFNIPEQRLEGASYHNIGEEAKNTTEVTVENNIPGIKVTATGTKAGCQINPAQTLTGTYTTGNVIATAESEEGGVMANAWWK